MSPPPTFQTRFLAASRVVIADSEHTRRDILSTYGIPAAKVRVIYPGYDASVFFCADPTEPPRLHEGPYLLHVGNLLPHKNLPCHGQRILAP